MDTTIAMVRITVGDCIATANTIPSKWIVEGNIPSIEAVEMWWAENAVFVETKLQELANEFIENLILQNIEDGSFEQYE